MEKPNYAKIETIVRSEDKIHECIVALEDSLRKAFDEKVVLIERKLATVTQENTALHHERLLLAKEIQKLRSEKETILRVLGVRKDLEK